MALFTVPFEDFAGLDLTSAVNETTGAIDCLNVDFDTPGRLRSRDGYTQLSAGAADDVLSMVPYGSAGNFVTLGPTQARVYDNTGATVASSVGMVGTSYNLVNFAAPGSTYVYGPSGNANTHILRWDGASWTYPNVGYSGRFVSATPWDNRLILCIDAAGGNTSRVRFSDAGAPETYTANSYVDLTPGDGEPINGICAWRDKVFVFKHTKFFVFYGTSTDNTGQPIFNYRTINTGIGGGGELGTGLAGPVAMDDAVYFLNQKGVYRTTGGPPEKMSTPVDPLFGIGTARYFTPTLGSTFNSPVLARYRKKILACFGTDPGSPYIFVFDTEHMAWSFWNIPATCAMEWSSGLGVASVPLLATLAGPIHKMGSAYSTDNGTAITSRYRSPYVALDWRGRTIRSGIHGVDKTIRESLLEGTGTVTYTLANQWTQSGSLPTGRTVVMGTSPQVALARDRTAVRGRMFSWQISATGPWMLETLAWNVHGYQAAGEESETR